MYPLEILLVIVLLVLLVAQNVRGISRNVSLACFAIGLFIILLSTLLGQARWQMAPAYLLFVILSLLLLKRSHSHVVLRSIGIAFGALLLGIGVMLSLALPIVTLPAPDGPHVVGSRSFSLTDESRNEAYFGAPDERRELYLQVWYPGTIDQAQPPPSVRTLWEELYRGPRDPVTFLFGYLRGIKTHTYQDIPLSTTDTSYPVIVFSHSMGLNAEQNTPLMEHLASHGYVVIGISHTRMTVRVISSQGQPVFPDPNRLRDAFTEGAADRAQEFDVRAARTNSAEERAEIVFELGERAVSMNEQVAIRVSRRAARAGCHRHAHERACGIGSAPRASRFQSDRFVGDVAWRRHCYRRVQGRYTLPCGRQSRWRIVRTVSTATIANALPEHGQCSQQEIRRAPVSE